MEAGFVFKVEEGGSCEWGDMLIEREGTVNCSKIVNMRGGRQNGAVNIEAEVKSGFGEGFEVDDV